jgi:hypothetical protein
MIGLAVRGLIARPWRALLTGLAAVIGVSLVAGALVLADTAERAGDVGGDVRVVGDIVLVAGAVALLVGGSIVNSAFAVTSHSARASSRCCAVSAPSPASCAASSCAAAMTTPLTQRASARPSNQRRRQAHIATVKSAGGDDRRRPRTRPRSAGLSVLRQKGVEAAGAAAVEAAGGLAGDVRETAFVGADAPGSVKPGGSEELRR